ncbi:hypothetical protein [Brevibacillus dissolubilis]|uniref:hypothetical protein n=1 Tax=Brevibacillus dissolubilis TaxID=1844116 RepID=UPI0021003D44|nr:hypothetical protein [Brevibacillus dissolubilis]
MEMNFMCPICNGFTELQVTCESCGSKLDDQGRLLDYFGDYSPYRPFDDLKRTDGYPDVSSHLCPHVATCPACRLEQVIMIQEATVEQVIPHLSEELTQVPYHEGNPALY